MNLEVSEDSLLEISNISTNVFSPLNGFMKKKDYDSVVEHMHLISNEPWTIPITLECKEEEYESVKKSNVIKLTFKNKLIATLNVEDCFKVNYANDIKKIFGVDDQKHPGVKKETSRSPYRIGGEITSLITTDVDSEFYLSPEQTKVMFKKMGWNKIASFQTRNPLHRAHEYLQRVAMEVCDGIFIQPLVGWKRNGDFTAEAVVKAYKKMFTDFYPEGRAILGTLKTSMRYAGPREAVFHAIIRRNFGCTHFIVGRDHAGVGNFYGKYEAQQLARNFKNLGIEILPLAGPFYCKKCLGIVTEKTCQHDLKDTLEISGTTIRDLLNKGQRPPSELMREEIADILIELNKNNNLFYGGII